MTIYEVEAFLNHKYGEICYVYEDAQNVYVLTSKSKWFVHKSDGKRFGEYTLFHANQKSLNGGYHAQMKGYCLEYLVYCAAIHDYDDFWGSSKSWVDFNKAWELYQYGQQLWESVQTFNFLSD